MSKGRNSLFVSKKWQNVLLALLLITSVGLGVYVFASTKARDEAAAAAAQLQPKVEFTKPPEKPVALFFGDSYFNGSYPVSDKETFGYLAGNQLGYEVGIRGYGGTGFLAERTEEPVTPNFAAQINDGELSLREGVTAPLVVVEGGLMDQRASSPELRKAVSGVLKSARKIHPNAKIILVGPANVYTPVSPSIPRIEDAMAAAAAELDVPMIRISDLVSRKELLPLIGEDGIHPTKEGHELLGKRLAAKLLDVGVKDESTS